MVFENKAKIIEVNLEKLDQDSIDQAALVLAKGGLVVYPTDTAYGLGANAYDEIAVKKLYNVKQRIETKPTHVIVRNWNMLSGIVITNDAAEALHNKFMPGSLTLILNKKEGIPIPDLLTGGLPTLGVRIPNNKVTQAISRVVKFPYTTPSANRSGEKTPYSITDVLEVLGTDGIDLILDAGPLPEKTLSVVVDLSNEESFRILRQGEIKQNEIMSVLRETYKRKHPTF